MLLVLDSAYRRFLVEPGVASTHEPRHGVHYGEEDVQLMPTERLERVLQDIGQRQRNKAGISVQLTSGQSIVDVDIYKEMF